MDRAEDYAERSAIMLDGIDDPKKTKQIRLLAGQESAKKWWSWVNHISYRTGWSMNKIRRYDGEEIRNGTPIR